MLPAVLPSLSLIANGHRMRFSASAAPSLPSDTYVDRGGREHSKSRKGKLLVIKRVWPNVLVIKSLLLRRVRARGNGSRTRRSAWCEQAQSYLSASRDRPDATARIDRNGLGSPPAAA